MCQSLPRCGLRIAISELTEHAIGFVEQNQLTHSYSLPDLMLECRAIAPLEWRHVGSGSGRCEHTEQISGYLLYLGDLQHVVQAHQHS